MTQRTYTVTVTPKYQGVWAGNHQSGAFTVTVQADSKRDANRRARQQLEAQGHYFRGVDACTFSAVEDTTPRHNDTATLDDGWDITSL